VLKFLSDGDLIPWEEAVAVGGNYFLLARDLGLPLPPRVFVYHASEGLSLEQMKLVGDYHGMFMKAEARFLYMPHLRRGGG
jgi:hypothetical protein